MKVSIILPTYNGGRFITKAIKSVLGQSFADYEFLIVDDGSTDNTPEIVKEFSRKDKRIRYVREETIPPFSPARDRSSNKKSNFVEQCLSAFSRNVSA